MGEHTNYPNYSKLMDNQELMQKTIDDLHIDNMKLIEKLKAAQDKIGLCITHKSNGERIVLYFKRFFHDLRQSKNTWSRQRKSWYQ